jgi:outer membrane receptor protein involved in Fe transport
MNWKNGQIPNQQFVQNAVGSAATTTVMVTLNTGEVRLRGLELEADFAASNRLTLSGTLNYANNKILNYLYVPRGQRIQNNANVAGNTLDQTPELTFTLSPTYTRHFSNDWEWSSRVDYMYRSKIYIDPTNLAWLNARGLVNGRVAFKKSGSFRVELFVNNLLDDDTLSEAGTATNDAVFGPNTACPPCYNPALAPVITPAVSVLNIIGFAPPIKRTFGIRFSHDF